MRKGFTLIEIIMVIAIIGILASLILPQVIGTSQNANITITISELGQLEAAISNSMNTYNTPLPKGKDKGPKTEEEMNAEEPVLVDEGNSKFFELFDTDSPKSMSDPLWTPQEERLKASLVNPERKVYLDNWGNPYIYKNPGEKNKKTFDLYSRGPNGLDEDGDGDDIMMKTKGL